MNKKYTFWELCNSYHKIEIPIIQRDYAQGRSTPEVQRLRKKFVDDYLIESVLKDEPIELDFVYGSILIEIKEDEKQKIFIPLDGQQRLTTLFLLHFFIALKENKLNEIKNVLQRFSYETRPSAHDFCKSLLELKSIANLSNIKSEIEDSVWFNEEWKNDPTVSGMLNMLNTLSSNENLINASDDLLDKFIGNKSNLVTFYFTDLDEFGLTENLYIRMNARGKMLTEFENFKSEFSKIIRYNHSLLEDVKNKIEYEWVDNLWDYREEDSFVIDAPFMEYLDFITEMLYFKDAEFRAKGYESNFLDFQVLQKVYAKEENLKFLIFSFDFIKEVKFQNESILWDGESLHSILKDILSGRRDINQLYVFFSTLLYRFKEKPKENLNDFVRVVRNLIENTVDNSRREWSRLLSSLQNLISDDNVYEVLAKLDDESILIGFNLDQRKEEAFKANLILKFDEYKKLIFRIEDHSNFKGNIRNILITPFVNSEELFEKNDFQTISYEPKYFDLLEKLFEAYKQIAKEDFNKIKGDMLITGLFTQTYESRLIFSHRYKKHPAILIFAKNFAESKITLINYLEKIQKRYILRLEDRFEDFSKISQVKDQLYLYYILTERIYKLPFDQFFKNHNFNFGWLKKESGYKSYFSNGIDDCHYFPVSNPIFQVYNHQFRYNLGINKNNTLEIEIIGGNKKRNPFELVKNWASEN